MQPNMLATLSSTLETLPYLEKYVIDDFSQIVIKSEDGYEILINHLVLASFCNIATKLFEDALLQNAENTIISSNLSQSELKQISDFISKGALPCSKTDIANGKLSCDTNNVFLSLGINLENIVKSNCQKTEKRFIKEEEYNPAFDEDEEEISFTKRNILEFVLSTGGRPQHSNFQKLCESWIVELFPYIHITTVKKYVKTYCNYVRRLRINKICGNVERLFSIKKHQYFWNTKIDLLENSRIDKYLNGQNIPTTVIPITSSSKPALIYCSVATNTEPIQYEYLEKDLSVLVPPTPKVDPLSNFPGDIVYDNNQIKIKLISKINKNFEDFKCVKCNKTFDEEKTLKRHISVVHKDIENLPKNVNSSKRKLSNSNKGFENVDATFEYILNWNSKDSICEICDKKFDKKDILKCHISSFHHLDLNSLLPRSRVAKSNLKI